MSQLFGKAYKLIFDDIEIVGGEKDGQVFGLDIAFKIEKTIKAEPNKATVQVWNLNPDHRGDFERRFGSQLAKNQRKPIRVELSAGYGDDIGIIFAADLRNLQNKQDGVDFITEVEGADGGHAWKVNRVARSFAPGVSVQTVLRAVVDAMGIGKGNLDDEIASIKMGSLGSTFPEGCVLSGQASKELNRLLKGTDFSWSVQGGVLQVKKRGEPVNTQVFELAADSGLIGSPYAEVDATVIPGKTGTAPTKPKTRSGAVKFQTLLLHQLFPGQKVKLKSNGFDGGYQITDLAFIGDTATNDWRCEAKGIPY